MVAPALGPLREEEPMEDPTPVALADKTVSLLRTGGTMRAERFEDPDGTWAPGPLPIIWGKFDFQALAEHDGENAVSVCLAGAVAFCEGRGYTMPVTVAAQVLLEEAGRVILENYRDRLAPEQWERWRRDEVNPLVVPNMVVSAFNDHDQTTVDDVIAVLEKAKARLEERP